MKALLRKAAAVPILQNTTVRNLSYLMTAEGCSRVARVAVTVVMARLLSVSEFGTLALALTIHELIAVLAHNGFGLRILKQQETSIAATANSAYVLSFAWALGMFLTQLLVGSQLREFGFTDSGQLLQGLAAVHLLLPFALTHVHMIHRKGRLGAFAAVGTLQTIGECLFTFLLLLSGLGLWAIVIARLLSTLIWVIGFRRTDAWSFEASRGFAPLASMFLFTAPVLLSEYAKSVRLWGDNLLVGSLLGQELLGLYYFAKNSGLGISLSLSQISISTITPRLAEIAREPSAYRQHLRQKLMGRFSLFLAIAIGGQALLAPLYVPILFGDKWQPAVLLLALMCVSAIPRSIADLHACLARTSGLTALEMQWNTLYTLSFLALVFLVAGSGLELLATAMILLNVLMATSIYRQTWRHLGREAHGNPSGSASAQFSG